jgi:hypothetical protein
MTKKTPVPVKPFTVRTALVTVLALIVAIAAVFLFFSAVHSVGLAVLTGGTAFAGAWRFFDRMIG